MNSEINSESLPAVKSLRSKFEQLASNSDQGRSSNDNSDLLNVRTHSPRPRATSGTFPGSPSPEVQSLRPSSSSSDLQAAPKRAPPPPPPRGLRSAAASPAPSPLMRPVPMPSPSSKIILPSPRSVSAGALPGLSLAASSSSEAIDTLERPSVASLKNKFNASHLHSPRPSISSITSNVQAEIAASAAKPAVPPRIPPKPIEVPNPTAIPSSDRFVYSPDQMSQSSPSDSLGSTGSPITEEEEDKDNSQTATAPKPSLPPPVPPRIPQNVQKTRHISLHNLGGHFSDPSPAPYDSDPSQTQHNTSHRLSIVPPPRPSLRPGHADAYASLPVTPKTTISPPPLPVRRGVVILPEEPQAPPPPRLPGRPQQPPVPTYGNSPVEPGGSSVSSDRKSLGSSRLPPPPTRTIGPGDRLPPARRPTSPSSDEDSAEEDDTKATGADSMPDSSKSSRRPPVLSFRYGSSEPKIHVHPHSGLVAASGTHVIVAHGHHVKIYDVAKSDVPVFNLDTKDLGVKDAKVTSMEFRPTTVKEDRGYLLWIGTKEGHLIEADIRTGTSCAIKPLAHPHPITSIFRHGRSMVTLDEAGKALVYSPELRGDDISLQYTVPRIIRTTEKQEFVKLLDGKLWAASRTDHQTGHTMQKLPIIRVFDLFNPASTGRSILPLEHVGPVTSATILPSQPGYVYMGHEEGFITLWALATEDGFPQCIEVFKVSASDVLCLEGVNDKLWAGARNGMISAYDVTHKPWLVTNSWTAHPGVPVYDLMMNHNAIERTERLCVVSIGRDEQLRLWDGLLGLDWIDNELLKRETTFSTFHDLTALVVSWNCDSARPDSLNGDPVNFNFLNDALQSVESPDIIAFGFQEVIDLESRKMAAKNVLLGSKRKPEDAGLSDKVTGAYKRWYDRLVIAVRAAMPVEESYSVVHTESLVGLFTCIFVKSTRRTSLNDVAVTTVKRGMGGRYGNKGGIVARFVIGDSSICLINSHLAAGQNAIRRRNADAAGLLEEKAVFASTEHPLAYVGGGDGTMVLDHEIVIFHGDLNYRIEYRRDAIVAAVRAGDLASLMTHDQLLREIKFNRGCRLRGFCEGPLTFAPTYKYDPRSNEYDSSEKHRAPAWCDRILWHTRIQSRVRQLHYRRYEVNVSDHRPISAAFVFRTKTVQSDTREQVKLSLEVSWNEEQKRLLAAAKDFYVKQALI